MIGFWISAALMIAAALAFLLPPLIGRVKATDTSRDDTNLAIYRERRQELAAQHAAGGLDDAALAAAVADLDRDLLRDVDGDAQAPQEAASRNPYPAIAVAVMLPLAAFGLYLKLGTPEVLMGGAATPERTAPPQQAAASGDEIPHSVAEMVEGLARRMEQNPEDPEGWLMLGRSYAAMNRLQDARAALEEADQRRPDHTMTLVALAEVMAGLQGNVLEGEPARLVARALELDPNFARALWLAGVDAFSRNDPGAASGYWQRILALPGLSPEAAAQVTEALAQAGAAPQAAPAANTASAAAPASAPAAADGASLTVSVALSPELASRVSGSETLFVFARAASGPRMPLAIARLSAADLPAQVTLDESMAMTPQMTLGTFPQVVVGARISRSGNATPTSGDLEGSSEPLSPAGGPEVDITIDRVVP